MSKKFLLSLLFIGAFCSKMQAQTLDSFQITVNDSIRTYKIYVPAAYKGDEPWPLVLVLHGYSLDANFMIAFTGLNGVADTAHFLVAYPQGLTVEPAIADTTSPFPPVGPGWNLEHFFTSENDDVAFISQLMDNVSQIYRIDPRMVYACGLSNGGLFANKLACELSDRIAAFASVAGGSTTIACNPGRSVPILFIHGTRDSISYFEGTPNYFNSIPNAIQFWATNNKCNSAPTESMLPDVVTSDSSTVNLKIYGNCEAGAEVRFYEIKNGGHTWPGQLLPPPPFVGILNEDFNASSEIWNFFKRFKHPDPKPFPGKVVDFQTIHDDSIRTYKVYVPAAYTGDEPWPLVMSLHGFSLDADFMIALTGMNEVADTAHFLVAYPQGLEIKEEFVTPPFPEFGTGWNLGNYEVSNTDDVSFLSHVIDEISQFYKVDSTRVYACGLSNGGSMVYRLACELSTRIAAVASASGGMAEDVPCSPSRPVPLFEIHGTADSLNPYSGVPTLLTPIQQGINFWVNQDGCNTDPVVVQFPDIDTTDGTTATLKKYLGCNAGTEVWLMDIIDGGHVWPTSYLPPPPFIGPTNRDVHGSSEIWNFFKRFVHPNPLSTGTKASYGLIGNLSLYPNPTNGLLNIDFQFNTEAKEIEIGVYNVLGFSVYREKLGLYDKYLQKAINLQQLPGGIYLLRLKSGNQFITQKFVKTN